METLKNLGPGWEPCGTLDVTAARDRVFNFKDLFAAIEIRRGNGYQKTLVILVI